MQQQSLYEREAELREVQMRLREYVESAESETHDSAGTETRGQRLLDSSEAARDSSAASKGNLLRIAGHDLDLAAVAVI